MNVPVPAITKLCLGRDLQKVVGATVRFIGTVKALEGATLTITPPDGGVYRLVAQPSGPPPVVGEVWMFVCMVAPDGSLRQTGPSWNLGATHDMKAAYCDAAVSNNSEMVGIFARES
eukprot:Lankesteria_metandrocarpae@DN4455_c0_g1_i1.p2